MAVLVSTVKTNPRPLGDLIRNLFHPGYNFISATVKNPDATTATIEDPLGLPVKKNGSQWEFVDAADIANCGGILVHDKPLEDLAQNAITAEPLKILVRGPAIIHEDGLSPVDHLGDAIVAATFKTEAEDLELVVIEGPSKTSTQTT
jgi:hypothetical protein